MGVVAVVGILVVGTGRAVVAVGSVRGTAVVRGFVVELSGVGVAVVVAETEVKGTW